MNTILIITLFATIFPYEFNLLSKHIYMNKNIMNKFIMLII